MPENKLKLYGDGKHDDSDAIQALLDSRRTCIYLPPPEKNYAIGKTLYIHSGQELKMDAFTVIKLLPQSNCAMIANSDPKIGNKNIVVVGGVWDINNVEQERIVPPCAWAGVENRLNRIKNEEKSFCDPYAHHGLRFANVNGLTLSGLTISNAVVYGALFGFVENFTIENINFDYSYDKNGGHPRPINMDGLHFEGGCRNGIIKNLKGSCYDDLIAFNNDEWCCGPIENIRVDGIWSYDSHSAIRFLSRGSVLKNITVSNVYGTFYQYAFGFTKYYDKFQPGSEFGLFKNIVFRDIYAAKAERLSVYLKDGTFEYPLVWFEDETIADNILIDNWVRDEKLMPHIPLVGIEKGAIVKNLKTERITTNLSSPITADKNLHEWITSENIYK